MRVKAPRTYLPGTEVCQAHSECSINVGNEPEERHSRKNEQDSVSEGMSGANRRS